MSASPKLFSTSLDPLVVQREGDPDKLAARVHLLRQEPPWSEGVEDAEDTRKLIASLAGTVDDVLAETVLQEPLLAPSLAGNPALPERWCERLETRALAHLEDWRVEVEARGEGPYPEVELEEASAASLVLNRLPRAGHSLSHGTLQALWSVVREDADRGPGRFEMLSDGMPAGRMTGYRPAELAGRALLGQPPELLTPGDLERLWRVAPHDAAYGIRIVDHPSAGPDLLARMVDTSGVHLTSHIAKQPVAGDHDELFDRLMGTRELRVMAALLGHVRDEKLRRVFLEIARFAPANAASVLADDGRFFGCPGPEQAFRLRQLLDEETLMPLLQSGQQGVREIALAHLEHLERGRRGR